MSLLFHLCSIFLPPHCISTSFFCSFISRLCHFSLSLLLYFFFHHTAPQPLFFSCSYTSHLPFSSYLSRIFLVPLAFLHVRQFSSGVTRFIALCHPPSLPLRPLLDYVCPITQPPLTHHFPIRYALMVLFSP